MAVLYRKYRPQTFADVLGQKYIIQTLQNQVASGQFSHAYLFTGSRGVGKTSVARILAKAVNCLNSNKQTAISRQQPGDACGTCDVCKQIEAGNFLDLIEIDAASNTGVDNIRELIEHVKFSPSTGKYKVFIIDEVHMLSKGAFNALLKTLEEPPKHAIFILATTEINKVPDTIISRTQRFDFKRYRPAELQQLMEKILKAEKIELPEAVLKLISHNADGGARDALSLLDKVLTIGADADISEYEQLLGVTDIKLSQKCLELIVTGAAGEIPEFFESLQERGTDFAVFNRDFLEYLRHFLIYKITGGKESGDLTKEHLEWAQKFAEKISIPNLIFYTRLFLKSYKELDFAPNPLLPPLLAALEAAMRNTGHAAVAASRASVSENIVADKQAEKKSPELAEEFQDMTMDELSPHWSHIVEKIKEVNGPLGTLVKNSPVQRVEKGRVCLGVRFLFHKENLENRKNAEMISGIIGEVSGKKMGIRAELIKGEEKVPDALAIGDALKLFGGELIE